MKNRNVFMRQQGFTMIEALMTLAMIAVLTGAIYGAASAMRRSYSQNTLNNYNLLAVKKGLSRIADELRYATGITLATTTTTNDTATVTFNSGSTTTISLQSVSTGGNSLKLVTDGTTTTIAEPLVESLKFTQASTACIKVTMQVTDPSDSDNPALQMYTTVRMLNVSE